MANPTQESKPKCFCDVDAAEVTSNSEKNPGRQFYTCPKGKDFGCGYFFWVDEWSPEADALKRSGKRRRTDTGKPVALAPVQAWDHTAIMTSYAHVSAELVTLRTSYEALEKKLELVMDRLDGILDHVAAKQPSAQGKKRQLSSAEAAH